MSQNTEKTKAEQQQEAPKTPTTELSSSSSRFTAMVLREYNSMAGAPEITDEMRTRIQGYFISIDSTLKDAEAERLRKNASNSDHKWDNPLPVLWENVNLKNLAQDVVYYAKLGLDMMLPNHLNAIPYRNKKTDKYDIGFLKGYDGIVMLTFKYALDKPKAVVYELVYSNDAFKVYKKGIDRDIETYDFDICQPFDRGQVIGGFGYLAHEDPTKNKLILMSKKDMDKRRPEHAAAEFWGGIKTVWENGTKVEKEIEGWADEMYRKTLIRHVYGQIELDPKKIDDAFMHTKEREAHYAEMRAEEEIEKNANKQAIVIDSVTGEIEGPEGRDARSELPAAETKKPESEKEPELQGSMQDDGQMTF